MAFTTFFKWTARAAALVLVLAAGAALYVELDGIPRYRPQRVDFAVDKTPERVARGRRTTQMLCASCHRDPATGALTGRRIFDMPPGLGEVYASNITQDWRYGIGAWTDAEIAYLVRTGITRDGRYTPPWMVKLPLLSDEDLRDVIAFLRSDDPLVRPAAVPDPPSVPSFLAKALTHFAFGPLPYPEQAIVAPPAADRVAYGRYLVTAKLTCFTCHSLDYGGGDRLAPETTRGYLGGGYPMSDRAGRRVYSSNLTPDVETGLGLWTEEQFHRALKLGLRPDGRPFRRPMTARADLTDDEIGAIWAYLRTVPPRANRVPPPEPIALAEDAHAGQAVYFKYGCNSCHGDDGSGPHDLRQAARRHPQDAALVSWIKHPERQRPGITMPTWDGVIAEEEYAPLVGFVRSLQEDARANGDSGPPRLGSGAGGR